MPQAYELALRLVEFDRDLAKTILAALEEEIGGGPGDSEVGDPATTTREWKAQFAHHERARALAGELAQLLR